MDSQLRRAYLVEFLGSFALVFFGAGVVLVNFMTTPEGQHPGTASLLGQQPGLAGIALAQGLILAALLGVSAAYSGGYFNPAITLMLWVFNRLNGTRTSWFLGAQILGGVLAGLCLQQIFAESVQRDARMGTPHLNALVYSEVNQRALVAGTGVELVLTFFFVLAILSSITEGARLSGNGLTAGLALAACVVVGYPLTGAALNPGRWLGTALWEYRIPGRELNPIADVFVYVAGPVLGALLAGFVWYKVLQPAREDARAAAEPGARPAESHIKQGTVKARK